MDQRQQGNILVLKGKVRVIAVPGKQDDSVAESRTVYEEVCQKIPLAFSGLGAK